MSVTVIVPTTNRPTLSATLRSCAGADEIIVVADGTDIGPLYDTPDCAFADVKGGDLGYTARTLGIELATSTHLAFLDDDDVYTADAIDLFREYETNSPVIFRMNHPTLGVLWRDRELRYGNVGTPMFLVPNDPDRLGRWTPALDGRGGDFSFIRGCCARMGDPVWREEIVAEISPAGIAVGSHAG